IVYGLEVVARGGREIVVAPGVGIDSDGNVIVLSEASGYTLKEGGQNYVLLLYRASLHYKSEITLKGGGTAYYRLIEGRHVEVTKELPTDRPYLELARMDRSGPDKELKEA